MALIVYLSSAGWHVLYGGMNTDEGFYAVATRAVANGEVPYRDFGFTQPPLVLYANSLPLRGIGFGLFAQRAVNGLWAAVALLIAARWLARRTRCSWGVVLVLIFAFTSPWMYFIHTGKTYGLTTLVVMLATWAFLAMRPTPWRNFVLGVLAVVAAGTRLPSAPCVGLLWLLALWPNRRPNAAECAAAFGSVALAGAAIILPFWLAAPEQMKFWTFDFHRISVPIKNWHLHWQEIITLAPAVWVLAAIALLVAVWRHRLLTREVGAMLAAGVALAANLLPLGVYDEYAVPFFLPLAVGAAALVFDEFKARKTAVSLGLAAVLVAANLLTAPLVLFRISPERHGTTSQWLTPNSLPYNRALPAQLAGARHVIETALAPDAPFVGPNLILAAETGRSVPRELRMGTFTFTDEMLPDRAARLHLATRGQLDIWFSLPQVTTLAFFKRFDLDYNWSMPSFTSVPSAIQADTLERLQRDFEIAYSEGEFVVLVRRETPAPFPQ